MSDLSKALSEASSESNNLKYADEISTVISSLLSDIQKLLTTSKTIQNPKPLFDVIENQLRLVDELQITRDKLRGIMRNE